MAVDRAGEAEPETADKPPAPPRRPPPDNPGADQGPSRADSRAGAAAANSTPADARRATTSRPAQPADAEKTGDRSSGPSAGDTSADDEPGTAFPGGDAESDGTAGARDDDVAAGDPVEDDDGASAGPVDDAPRDAVEPQAAADDVAEADASRPDHVRPDIAGPAERRRDDASAAADQDRIREQHARSGKAATSDDGAGRPGAQAPSVETSADPAEQSASSRAEATGLPETAPDRPVVTDDGGWEWKGLHLTPEDNVVAEQALDARRAAEGRDVHGEYGVDGLTPDMRRLEQELGCGELVADTEKFALKGTDRFKEKLAKRIALEPDKPTRELAAEIHDGIRYTFTFPADEYTSGLRDAEDRLRRRGYELRQRRPSWGDGQYKGVNSRWHDPGSGLLFEVQFHTPESWEAKQRTHDAYAAIENPETSEAEKEAARKYQREISAAVPLPDEAAGIPPYPDERH